MSILSGAAHKVARRMERRRQEQVRARLLDPGQEALVRIGTSYGGWFVPERVIVPGEVAVCAGAGEDITFDVDLNRRGMQVLTVDPTPRAARHVREVLEGAARGAAVAIDGAADRRYDFQGFDTGRFTFLELGLADKDATLRFWAPSNPEHVSHSIANLQNTGEYFDAQCVRLETLCRAQSVDAIAILKLDIEGAEYAVLKDLAEGQIRPRAVCVEFDEGIYGDGDGYLARIVDATRQLKSIGYRLVKFEGWNFVFQYESL